MTQIVDLARQVGRLEELLAQANRDARQLRIDNARLTHEIADSIGPAMEPPS